VIIDVLNWLGWEHLEDPAGLATRWIPPDAEPLTLVLDPECAATRLSIDCDDQDEALARILLDEIHGAIQRLAGREGQAT
jgi:hypothetical protein